MHRCSITAKMHYLLPAASTVNPGGPVTNRGATGLFCRQRVLAGLMDDTGHAEGRPETSGDALGQKLINSINDSGG